MRHRLGKNLVLINIEHLGKKGVTPDCQSVKLPVYHYIEWLSALYILSVGVRCGLNKCCKSSKLLHVVSSSQQCEMLIEYQQCILFP